MKNSFERLKKILIIPFWILLAILQFTTALIYLGLYWFRFFLLEKGTKAKFAKPKLFLNRTFEASDIVIYNPNISNNIKADY